MNDEKDMICAAVAAHSRGGAGGKQNCAGREQGAVRYGAQLCAGLRADDFRRFVESLSAAGLRHRLWQAESDAGSGQFRRDTVQESEYVCECSEERRQGIPHSVKAASADGY